MIPSRIPIQPMPGAREQVARGDATVRVPGLPGAMFGDAEERRSLEWYGESLEAIAAGSGLTPGDAARLLTGVRMSEAHWTEGVSRRILAALVTAFERGRDSTPAPVEGEEFVTTTPDVLAYARNGFRAEVEGLLDDPSDLLHPGRECEPAEELARYRDRARRFGFDFDALVAETGSAYERKRLAEIESGVIAPLPAHGR